MSITIEIRMAAPNSLFLCLLFLIPLSSCQADLGNLLNGGAATDSLVDVQNSIPSTTKSSGCTDNESNWLDWSEWSSCTDTCGSCGMHMRTRTCLTTNSPCGCEGQSVMIEYCNLNVCRYPRSSCCYNFKAASLNGSFACLQLNTTTTP